DDDWTCQYSNVNSNTISLDVQYAPVITSVPSSKDVTENTSPNIDCSSNITPGNPSTTSYRWTGPGGYSKGGAVLDRPVTRTQVGVYICTASNTAGLSDTAQVNVNVQYAPVITSIPSNKVVTENTSPNIDCSSNITPGNPSTTSYRWTGPGGYSKDGAVLDRPVTRTQGGDYICTASNTAGLSATAQVNINVQYAPVITSVPSNKDVTENTSPNIDCSSNITPGNPSTTSYRWTGPGGYSKDGAVLDRRVTRTEGGMYICTASNTAGLSDTAQVNVNVQYAPVITSVPSNKDVTENTSPNIDCSSKITPGNPSTTSYRWTGPGGYSKDGAVLDRRVTRTEGGVYICTTSNTAGLSDTAQVNVNVQYAPVITSVPSNKDVTENTSPNIDCSSNITPGNPSTTSYRWTGPGGYSKDGAVLDRPVTRTQGGVYSCTASNTAGLSDTAQVNINVQYAPGTSVSITPSSPHTVVEGTGPVSIRCTADCNPSCGLQLRKGTTDVGQGQVTLDKVNRAQARDYTCEAENVIGNASKQFTLVVHYPVNISMFTVNSLSRSVTVNELDQATLTCQVDSNPKSVIRLLNGTEELTRADNSLTATYRLESVECRQRGNYSCTATNNIGAPVTTKVELLIKCSPRLDETVPKQLKYASRQGENLTVSVPVLAYPLPTFTWSRSISTSQDLTGSSSPVSDISVTARLHLTNIQEQDFGDYSLTVDNGVGGSVTYTVNIVTTGPPSTPTNISVSPEGPFSLHVSWKEEFNGGATQTFTVEYSTDEKDWKTAGSHTETESGNYMTSSINDLNSDTLYYVRVVARNQFGSSSYTEHATGLTEKKVMAPAAPSQAGLIAGVTVGVILVVGIVVIVVIMARKGYRCILQKPDSTDTQNASQIPENRGENVNFQDVNQYSGLQDSADDKQTYTELKNYENTEFHPSKDTVNTYEDINQTSRHASEDGKPAMYVNADIKGKDSPYVNT
ncbi:hemicentin-1-like, partial [Haliotis rubra]|uniref:hemicentin-1-like n=1 Tax=Haliotis rubra TaxID=36100 RepID=UPI001EE5D1F6